MIGSFADDVTRTIFEGTPSRRLPPEVSRLAWRRLRMLDAAESLSDLRTPPGSRLEQLKGNRTGQYSIRVNDQWRICFTWRDGYAHEVEIVDYHD